MSGDVTKQALKRQSYIPDSQYPEGSLIAGQEYDNVYFAGGDITCVTISDLASPIGIADGGTGQITAQAALDALLPDQAGNSGKALKTNGTTASWQTDTDTGITQLIGDVTAGPGSGSQAATLATVNPNVGSFGSSASIPSLTVNAKGLITAASDNAVIAPAGTLTGNTLASGVTASSLTSVGTLTGLTMGGTLAMGTNSITMTGSLAATGARVTKGWFTNIESTNAPTVGGSAVYYAGGTVVSVADGGTGRSTGTTAYSLIATGTTATGAQQTLSNGATTEILVGGGASALPVWTTASGTGAPVRVDSPALTGSPTAPTQTLGDNSTKIATTAYVDTTITPWVAYTPTFTGFGTVSGVEVWSRRVGDTLEIRGRFTSGTSTAAEARMTLGFNGTNANVTSSSTKITSIQFAGDTGYSGAAAIDYKILIESNIGYITFGAQSGLLSGLTKQNGNNLISSGQTLSFLASIPISGW